jgi:molybdenum cofactor biosynthesis enzyme MoaA
MDYPERLSIHPLRGMVLNVTDACNCRCRYCFTSPNPRVMDLDTGVQEP